MTDLKFQRQFLHPKYWGIWLGYGLLRLLGLLPYATKIHLGEKIGQLLYTFSIKRANIARNNIKIAFPDKTDSEVQNILKDHFKSLGVGIMEITLNNWGKHRRTHENNETQYFTYVGLENLEAHANQGKLLLVPHFTTLEMTGLMLSFLTDYRPIYRQHDNPVLEYIITKSRTINLPHLNRKNVHPIKNTETLPMVKALRQHNTLMILPDQKYTGPGNIEVPFFNVPANSNPGICKLAKMGKAVTLPCFTRRKGLNYELHILPALENFPSGDDYKDTLRLHHLYEAEIRQNPSQYLWVHDRWSLKNNPEKRLKYTHPSSHND